MTKQDFLLELGTEEMPPKLLPKLSSELADNIVKELDFLKLSYQKIEKFATPRRLAVVVRALDTKQNDLNISKKGPALSAPEQAIMGFAKSCGVDINQLEVQKAKDKEYYFFNSTQTGKNTKDLLENIANNAIKNLSIPRPMRWGSHEFAFIRPVHWLIMLFGADIIPVTIMNLKSGRQTRALRFANKLTFDIKHAKDYQKELLMQANIEPDFALRKENIRTQIKQIAQENNATAVIDESLLEEVCALVEYPKAFIGNFDERFLSIPSEALISAMKKHQKYFHLVDKHNKLLAKFISVANLKSDDMSVVVNGNERVIRPRLSDAEFFYEQDKKQTLESRVKQLKNVLFMQDLGSMADKVKRIEILSIDIAKQIQANVENSKRAAMLCKSDLITDMVGEFADLQGIMGGYYALNDGENAQVAKAITQHYHPRFAKDSLPENKEGLCVAIADKVDSIVGIYGIGHKPTGSKDPYALKRASVGLLRMIIEAKLDINITWLIDKAVSNYNFKINKAEINKFILERLDAYYQEQNIDKNTVQAVLKSRKKQASIYDMHLRIKALSVFIKDKNSKNLIDANKRIKNILKNTSAIKPNKIVHYSKFDENLYNATNKASAVLKNNPENYELAIKELLTLKDSIDEFFENVMVNDENIEVKAQRMALISCVREVFLNIADFANI